MKLQIHSIHISYIIIVAILFILSLQTTETNPSRNPPHNARRLSEFKPKAGKEFVRRNKTGPSLSPKLKSEIVREVEKVVKSVEQKPRTKADTKPCRKGACIASRKEKALPQKIDMVQNIVLRPAYPCDEWDQDKRACFLNRNLGNTVTFVLSTPPPETTGKIRVEWRQEFAHINSERNRTFYYINPMDPPWNIVIGSRGHELRVSPISEIDLYNNLFTAVVHFENGSPSNKLHYIIRKIPIDVGQVYPGATLTLHIPSFVSLPADGMAFKWILNGALADSLPSNMRPSPSGTSLRISELRKRQAGVVVCFVYSNLGIQVSSISFSIRQVESENNKLVFIATRPTHSKRKKKKRSQQLEDQTVYFKNLVDNKRKVSMVRKNLDDKGQESSFHSIYSKKQQNLDTPSIRKLNPQIEVVEDTPSIQKLNPQIQVVEDTPAIQKLNPQIEVVEDNPSIHKLKPQIQVVEDTPSIHKLNPQIQAVEDTPLNQNLNPQIEVVEDTPSIQNLNRHIEVYEDTPPIGPQNHFQSTKPKQKSSSRDVDIDDNDRSGQDNEGTTDPPQNEPFSFQQQHKQEMPFSFQEQHKQEIQEEPEEIVPQIKHFKVHQQKDRTTTESFEGQTDFEANTSLPPVQERDKLAKLLGKCTRDSECSINAECLTGPMGRPGFCRCSAEYEGNGIFCWESGKWLI